MNQIFISYAKQDRFCAKILELALESKEFKVWQFQSSLRPGFYWREDIERGIDDSSLVVIILSEFSNKSHYVTFEWAYALGKQKAILPIRVDDSTTHPRLEIFQQVLLGEPSVENIDEIVRKVSDRLGSYEGAASPAVGDEQPRLDVGSEIDKEQLDNGIRAYLNARGFSAVSFDRIRQRVNPHVNDQQLQQFIKESADFAPGVMKDGKLGLRRR